MDVLSRVDSMSNALPIAPASCVSSGKMDGAKPGVKGDDRESHLKRIRETPLNVDVDAFFWFAGFKGKPKGNHQFVWRVGEKDPPKTTCGGGPSGRNYN